MSDERRERLWLAVMGRPTRHWREYFDLQRFRDAASELLDACRSYEHNAAGRSTDELGGGIVHWFQFLFHRLDAAVIAAQLAFDHHNVFSAVIHELASETHGWKGPSPTYAEAMNYILPTRGDAIHPQIFGVLESVESARFATRDVDRFLGRVIEMTEGYWRHKGGHDHTFPRMGNDVIGRLEICARTFDRFALDTSDTPKKNRPSLPRKDHLSEALRRYRRGLPPGVTKARMCEDVAEEYGAKPQAVLRGLNRHLKKWGDLDT